MLSKQLLELADRYAGLETRVGRLMNNACGPVCAACPKICCRAEMCRESVESPFLSLVRNRAKAKPAWSDEHGWLGPDGCRLSLGRPPVCYEFLCPAILKARPDASSQTRLQDLAGVLTRAGKRAIGHDHLVEIMTRERLSQVKPGRLAAHLDRAETELLELESFWL